MKGESGKHLTTNPPSGYSKNEENKDEWLIDEEAAKTVRYIFKLCAEGCGSTQIAKRLKAEKVLTPTSYKAQKSGELLPMEPFKWAQKTVAGILKKVKYIGHTENFKTTSKNYRSKKRVSNAKENRRLFENLDTLFKRIYEDMVPSRLTAGRFDKLAAEYEAEQKRVKQTLVCKRCFGRGKVRAALYIHNRRVSTGAE